MTHRIHITLTKEMHTALTRLSEEQGRPIAHLIRESISHLLLENDIPLQEVHPEWGGARANGNEQQG